MHSSSCHPVLGKSFSLSSKLGLASDDLALEKASALPLFSLVLKLQLSGSQMALIGADIFSHIAQIPECTFLPSNICISEKCIKFSHGKKCFSYQFFNYERIF